MATKILSLDGLNDSTICTLISQAIKTIPGVKYANIDFLTQKLTLDFEGREAEAIIKDVVHILEDNVPNVTIKKKDVGKTVAAKSRVPVPDIDFGRYGYNEDDIIPEPQAKREELNPRTEKQDFKFQEEENNKSKKAEEDNKSKEEDNNKSKEEDEEKQGQEKLDPNISNFIISFIISGFLFGISYAILSWEIISGLCLGAAMILSAVSTLRFHTSALQGKIIASTLIQIVTSVIVFFSGGMAEAVAAALIYQVGLFAVNSIYKNAQSKVNNAVDISPEVVTKFGQDMIMPVPLSEILPGDKVIIKAGMTVPFDGIVAEGSSVLDTSLLTGSDEPVSVNAGEKVSCGDKNIKDSLIIEVTRLKEFTEAAKMQAILDDGRVNETDTLWSIKKREILFILLELVVILLVTMWHSISGELDGWLNPVMVMLLLSAPCGLTSSAHVAQIAGISTALKKGIIIRTGTSLENICKIKTAILEFTGMLTKSEYHLVDIWVAEEMKEEINANDILTMAACVESGINHPIAKAIVSEYYKRTGSDSKLTAVDMQEQEKGYGVRAMLKRKMMLIGSEKFMRDAEIEVPANNTGLTCVYVTERGEYVGALLMEDPLRPEAAGIGERLHSKGIESVGLLTGCDRAVARPAGEKLGVDMAYFEQTQAEKIELLSGLVDKEVHKKQVLYAGSVQDEDLFVLPCTRIAMGKEAFSRLFSSADAVIASGELGKLDEAIDISRKAQGAVNSNLVIYTAAKILLLVAAIIWPFPLHFAAAANAVLALIIITNSVQVF